MERESLAAPNYEHRDPEMPFQPQDAEEEVLHDKHSSATNESLPTGMKLSLKELYRENEHCDWKDWSPDVIAIDPGGTSEAKQCALIVRRQKRLGQNSSVAIHSITIQSPLIRKALEPVFDDYKGMTTKLKDLTFNAPFHEFFYRWDRFQQQILGEKDELVLKHIKLLQSVISGEIEPHLEKRQELLDNGLVTFNYLWALFEPDAVIYEQSDGQDRLYRLINSEYHSVAYKMYFMLTCRYIDCDGDGFGYVTTSLALSDFNGIKPISELSIIPILLHSHSGEIWEKLQKRGKRFVQMNGFHYRSYSGLCTMNGGFFGTYNKRNIDNGRVIIDTKMWSTYNPDQTVSLEAFDNPLSEAQYIGDESLPFPSSRFGHDDYDLNDLEYRAIEAISHNVMSHTSRRRQPKDMQANNPTSLTDDQAVLCTPLVRGYCLTSKQWAQFYVDNVREIEWNREAFERVVLPHDYKEIIWASVESQLTNETDFDDIVQGKGQGIIMLLSGEPGVGKTLTAESVAEELKKPLYSMSAGQLGLTAREVEQQLHMVLELSTKWKAILLIDECDVFLEQRTTSDLERNKLVSVFLRLLEYYKGVMFLTTNRVSTFDAAFQSRIHLTIDYPKLDFHSRMLIWQTFVRPQSDAPKYGSNIKEQDIKALAKINMNGREIKNTVKTARLLASQKRVPLAMKHIATVLRVKDGSPALSKAPKGTTGLMDLMLLPFRCLIFLIFLPDRLASFIADGSKKDL